MATLEPGRPVEGVFAVRRKERRMSRKGSPYLALTLGDATGTIPAVIFDEPDWFAAGDIEPSLSPVELKITVPPEDRLDPRA